MSQSFLGPRMRFERDTDGVRASIQCERCLRDHSAVRFTVSDAIDAVSELNCNCPCYEEKPTVFAKLYAKFFGADKDPLRNVRYNKDRRSYFVQCSRCYDKLHNHCDESDENKAESARKMQSLCQWEIEPVVLCSKCKTRVKGN